MFKPQKTTDAAANAATTKVTRRTRQRAPVLGLSEVETVIMGGLSSTAFAL
jgi:hypothetical protein